MVKPNIMMRKQNYSSRIKLVISPFSLIVLRQMRMGQGGTNIFRKRPAEPIMVRLDKLEMLTLQGIFRDIQTIKTALCSKWGMNFITGFPYENETSLGACASPQKAYVSEGHKENDQRYQKVSIGRVPRTKSVLDPLSRPSQRASSDIGKRPFARPVISRASTHTLRCCRGKRCRPLLSERNMLRLIQPVSTVSPHKPTHRRHKPR